MHQLAVHTVGGVVGPGELMMLIVPEGDDLADRGQDPAAGDRPGQRRPEGDAALLRLQPAHDAGDRGRRLPRRRRPDDGQPHGRELLHRAHGGAGGQLKRLNGVRLVPGMPVEAFVQTGYRTVLSYLAKPLQDQMSQSFRQR